MRANANAFEGIQIDRQPLIKNNSKQTRMIILLSTEPNCCSVNRNRNEYEKGDIIIIITF